MRRRSQASQKDDSASGPDNQADENDNKKAGKKKVERHLGGVVETVHEYGGKAVKFCGCPWWKVVLFLAVLIGVPWSVSARPSERSQSAQPRIGVNRADLAGLCFKKFSECL